jgi:coatomer subunit beta'
MHRVLVVESGNKVHIWNWRTNEKLGEYKRSDEYHAEITVAQFIARKRWVVIGNSDGSILVLMCPSLEKLEEFKAQPDGITSLAVHPTRPFLLSCTGNRNPMRLWDWSRGWSCTTMFVVTKPVLQVMFNPKHSTTFASLHMNASIMVCIPWSTFSYSVYLCLRFYPINLFLEHYSR